MLIDFTSVRGDRARIAEFSEQFTLADLRAWVSRYVNATREIVDSVTDADLFYLPHDPDANDTFATNEDEKFIGWSLAHLVLHVTASAEEGATFTSLLARGIALAVGTRTRWEKDWKLVTTRAEIEQRLAECERLCLSYLSAVPDNPHLDVFRNMPEKLSHLRINAVGALLFSLMHWDEHLPQFRQVADQARANSAAQAGQR